MFAQPEPGLPLRSAVDNLPDVGIDDAASFVSEMSRKRERGSSLSQGSDSGEHLSMQICGGLACCASLDAQLPNIYTSPVDN